MIVKCYAWPQERPRDALPPLAEILARSSSLCVKSEWKKPLSQFAWWEIFQIDRITNTKMLKSGKSFLRFGAKLTPSNEGFWNRGTPKSSFGSN
jgi:hypothetical protein